MNGIRIKVFVLGLIFLASASVSENIPTAAINQLTGSGVSEGEIISLTNALRSELSRTGKFNMMERSQIEEVLEEQGFQHSGICADESCIVEIGKLLAVRYMFLGHVGKVGNTFTVNVRTIDVESGRVIADVVENHRGAVDNLLVRVIPSVAKELAGVREEQIRKRRWPLVVGGIAAAGAVPAVFLLLNSEENVDIMVEDNITGVDITW